VPLIAMVAERSGRNWRRRLRIAKPVRLWASRLTAKGSEDDGQLRFDRFLGVVEHRPGA